MSRQPAADPLPDFIQISWNDWPAFRVQHALRVDQVIQLEGAATEIICHEAATRRGGPTCPPSYPLTPSETPVKSKLALLLYTLHRLAALNPGAPQRRTLAGGLQIDLIVGLDGNTRLQLSRERVYPSDVEMATTLNAWPYPLGDVLPEKFVYHGRFYVKFAWPTPGEEKPL
jgi:hypothetical protein